MIFYIISNYHKNDSYQRLIMVKKISKLIFFNFLTQLVNLFYHLLTNLTR